jgi:6-pyruvoyltetrahydropterin/6-carboxytetrahydropterin synthase
MFTVRIETEFSAAHALRSYDGACARLHGHNWKVTVEAKTERLNELGMSIDFYELQRMTDSLLAPLDHAQLNDVPPFDKELNPTSENLAQYLYGELKKILPERIQLSFVAIGETGRYSAKYFET